MSDKILDEKKREIRYWGNKKMGAMCEGKVYKDRQSLWGKGKSEGKQIRRSEHTFF